MGKRKLKIFSFFSGRGFLDLGFETKALACDISDIVEIIDKYQDEQTERGS